MNQVETLFPLSDAPEPDTTRRDLVRALFRRRWIILASFLLVTTIAVGGVASLPPTYESTAKVLIRTEQQVTPSFFSGLAAYSDRRDTDPAGRRLENEMALIETAPIARGVVRERRLDWNSIYHPPLTHFTKPLIEAAAPLLEAVFGVEDRPPTEADCVAALQASLSVAPAESKTAESTSNLIVIRLKSPAPDTAHAVLEDILDRYLAFDRRLTDEAAVKARSLVATDVAAARRDMAAAEVGMRDFLARSRFDSGGPESERTPGRIPTDGLVTSARDNQTVTQLKSRLVELESDLTEARQIYKPDSENVRRVEREIAQLESRLVEEVERNADNFARYNALDRTLRTAEARSAELEKRLGEIDLFLQVNGQSLGHRVVIEPPNVPETNDWKRRAATAMLGSFMGLVLGIVLAGVGEYADTSLGTRDDVRRFIGVEAVSTLPRASRRERRAVFKEYVAATPRNRYPERRLALTAGALASEVTVGINGARERGHSLLVTSARRGEGKTFVATLLAGELARLGFGSVLLVDANETDQTLVSDAGVPYTSGPCAGDSAVDATAARPMTLTVLAAGNGHGTADDFKGTKLRAFLERECKRFDWIVIDGDSIEGGGVATVAHDVDGVVLVVEADVTRRHTVRHVLRMLGLADFSKVKVVLNRKRDYIPGFLYERV